MSVRPWRVGSQQLCSRPRLRGRVFSSGLLQEWGERGVSTNTRFENHVIFFTKKFCECSQPASVVRPKFSRKIPSRLKKIRNSIVVSFRGEEREVCPSVEYIPADIQSGKSSQLPQVAWQPLESVAMEIEALQRGGPELCGELARLSVGCLAGGGLRRGRLVLGPSSEGIKHSAVRRDGEGRERERGEREKVRD